jgi:hypothetical protein
MRTRVFFLERERDLNFQRLHFVKQLEKNRERWNQLVITLKVYFFLKFNFNIIY